MKPAVLVAAMILLATPALAQNALPPGTILPVRLDDSISSKKVKTGQRITARIMQDVPLPDGGRIRASTRVVGHIISVTPPSANSGARVSFKFDALQVAGRKIPIITNLRAVASLREIEDAQDPAWGTDRGTGPNAYTTVQVGGDVVYRGGGHVVRDGTVVGEPVANGVLVRVSDRPRAPCRAEVGGNESLQALWLFSSDACGAYGFPSLHIAHAGRTDPIGDIVLASAYGEVDIRSGSGMLLRVRSR
jgi:hypothetical protein